MSTQYAALNMFLDEACSPNNKVGFQTPEAKQQAIKDSMALVQAWVDDPNVAVTDGSVIRIYAKVSIIKGKAPAAVAQVVVDGETIDLPATTATAESDDIPF